MHLQAGRAGIRRSTGNLGLEEMLKLSGSGGFARRRETFGRVSESGGGGMGWRGGRVEPEIRMSWRASVISESGEGWTRTYRHGGRRAREIGAYKAAGAWPREDWRLEALASIGRY